MRRSDPSDAAGRGPGSGIDWRSWVALGWAVVFGVLYGRMVLQTRAPGAWDLLRSVLTLD